MFFTLYNEFNEIVSHGKGYIADHIGKPSLPGTGSIKDFQIEYNFAGNSLTYAFQAVNDADFEYSGGTADPGELPLNNAGALTVHGPGGSWINMLGFNMAISEFLTRASKGTLDAVLLSGDDSITDNDFGHKILGFGGKDTINGHGGKDTINGGKGDDTLNGDAGNDTLIGGLGIDRLFGGDGNDTEDGGKSNDLVHGGNGKDTLKGGVGDDTLVGGLGADTLTGGAGADKFVFQTLSKFNGQESGLGANKRDVITDFQHGIDKIDPSFILITPFHFKGQGALTGLGDIHFKYQGSDTLVEISTDADAQAELQILLKGHILLNAGDFVV